MRKIMLNGQWELAEAGNDRSCEVQVPGSVLSGLYGAGKIEDPFYRTNEDVTRELFRKDYEFSRTFVAAEDILKEEKIILVCEGLDTLADIYINGQKAGSPYLEAGCERISSFRGEPDSDRIPVGIQVYRSL